VKHDNDGNVIWRRNFGGSGFENYRGVAAVSDGFVAAGFSWEQSFGNGDWTGITGNGGMEAILVKYDNDGNIIWRRNFGGSGTDSYSAITAVSDGVVAVGRSTGSSFGNGDWVGFTARASNGNDEDAIIVKYDNDGNVVWKRNFGGQREDWFHSVTAVSDGIVAVGFSSAIRGGDWDGFSGRGGRDAIIVKFDNDGNVVWKRNFGGRGHDVFNSVTVVSDGIVAVGYSEGSSMGNGDLENLEQRHPTLGHAIVVKFDNDGNIVWANSLPPTRVFRSVVAVSDGVVAVGYIGGVTLSWGLIVKIDNDGNFGRGNSFGAVFPQETNQNTTVNATDFNSVIAVSDGVVALGRSSRNSFGNGDWIGFTTNSVEAWNGDAIIVKYPDLGTAPTSIRNVSNRRNTASLASFAGIRNGQIHLNLQAGNYTAELYNLQGRMVGRANITAINGVNATGLQTDNLARGVFILNVRQADGISVLRQRISVR
jgi:hypothetical protein